MDDVSVAEQGELAREFVAGVVEAFGLDAAVAVAEVDDETVEVSVTGEDLGLLIGPKGQTLSALQELARTVVQRNVAGRYARLHVDVAGYRQKRREALERFTRQVAEQVVSSGTRRVLEPMNPADRKVVHDTVNEIDGVATTSEGEEPRRRVVILPDAHD
jgi:spoIIIJ-associated protein